jgi:predicted short-subunit dehydrogenase-like oxidoreductase (DUF2520 family)
MRQVPQNLNSAPMLLIGSGRLAKHLQNFFELENIPFWTWSRRFSDEKDLLHKISRSSRLLFAISDSALPDLLNRYHDQIQNKHVVHFSGATTIKGAWSAHPLMTFSHHLYDLETYREIHFVLEKASPKLSELIPGLKNKFSYLAPEMRAKYHAACVISGNFSVLLWEYFFTKLSGEFQLDPQIAIPYMRQIEKNLEKAIGQKSVLTGPLARGDQKTIDSHLEALATEPMHKVYQAFVEMYQKTKDAI